MGSKNRSQGCFSGTPNCPSEAIWLEFLLTPPDIYRGTVPVRKNNALQNILWLFMSGVTKVLPMYPNNTEIF
jgi:hypothetical protein